MKSTRLFHRVAAAAATIAVIGLHAASSIAGGMSLTISGFSAPIEILSFHLAGSAPGLHTGGGGGSGINFQDASFTAPESAASPLEYAKLTSGQPLTSAQLQVLSPSTAQPISDWTFTDVVVSYLNISRDSASNGSAVTNFSLFYNKVSYRVFAANGSVAQQMCWDLILKAAC